MDKQELIDKYRSIPMYGRILIMAVLGAFYPLFTIYTDIDILNANLQTAKAAESAARRKFEDARNKKANLPEQEEKLAFVEQQLKKARENLPDRIIIEDTLEKTATIAKEVGVDLLLFRPEEEKPGTGQFKYMEHPVKALIKGQYNQVAMFFDRVVHLEYTVFVRDIVLTSETEADADAVRRGAQAAGNPQEQSEYDRARIARSKLRVKAEFNLVLFRSMTDLEMAMEGAPPSNQQNPANNGRGGQSAIKSEDLEDSDRRFGEGMDSPGQKLSRTDSPLGLTPQTSEKRI